MFDSHTALPVLLLITSAVLLTVVVVEFAVNLFENTLQATDLPQLARIRELQDLFLNQTGALVNQTQVESSDFVSP